MTDRFKTEENYKTPNTSIMCTVTQCANHCGSQQYCSLEKVKIGTHESDPTYCQCVDCDSFRLSNQAFN